MANCMIALTVCLILAASWSLCDALERSWILEEFRAGLHADAEQLADQMSGIAEDLKAELPFDSSIEANFKYIVGQSKCSRWKMCFSKNDPEKQRALVRLASLKSLADVCDTGSLAGLETIDLALFGYNEYTIDLSRIKNIVRDFQDRHTKACGPVYRQKYCDSVQSLNEDTKKQVEQVHLSLSTLSPLDFSRAIGFKPSSLAEFPLTSQQQRLITMPDFSILRKAREAQDKIALEIGRQLSNSHKWNLIKDPSTDNAKLNELLDGYLFEPCVQFRNKLGDAIQPALIVTTFEGRTQGKFISEDQDLFKAVFNFGVCGKLLQERKELYAELSQRLRSLPDSDFEKSN